MLTCPSPASGALATKNSGCASMNSRSRPSMRSYRFPMRASLGRPSRSAGEFPVLWPPRPLLGGFGRTQGGAPLLLDAAELPHRDGHRPGEHEQADDGVPDVVQRRVADP